jgi:hypothetical protein
MKPVDDIQHFWKWWSVRFGVLAAAFAGTAAAYALLPSDMLPSIPAWAKQIIAAGTLGFTFLSLLSRGVDQPKLRGE